jgi:hypothetical protein
VRVVFGLRANGARYESRLTRFGTSDRFRHFRCVASFGALPVVVSAVRASDLLNGAVVDLEARLPQNALRFGGGGGVECGGCWRGPVGAGGERADAVFPLTSQQFLDSVFVANRRLCRDVTVD